MNFAKALSQKPTALVIGPTPPPTHGVSMVIRAILDSKLSDTFSLIHLELADRRGIEYLAKPDLYDVLLFIKQFFQNIVLMLKRRPALVYIPISQTRIGFVRDSLFVISALMIRCPVIIHLHGGNFDVLYTHVRSGKINYDIEKEVPGKHSGFFWKAYMNVILKRVARFIVLGETLRFNFSRWTTPDQISVVPNGIPQDCGEEFIRTSQRREAYPFRVVFLSSTLNRKKGLFTLLEAIPPVIQEHKNVEFVIGGPWWSRDTQAEAEAWLVHAGIQEAVCFTGRINAAQKKAFLRQGDVFVFPGIQQEGQPLTVLEAMREGLPVIATDRGCLKETVIEGVTGFIVPPNSPKVIAEKILQLIRQPELREKMAESSRKRFESNYTLEKFIQRLEKVFLETLSDAH